MRGVQTGVELSSSQGIVIVRNRKKQQARLSLSNTVRRLDVYFDDTFVSIPHSTK